MAGSANFYPQWLSGEYFAYPTSKVVCIGRNYAAHAAELNNPVPDEPILFIKPSTSVVPFHHEIRWPEGAGQCHLETEVALLIGKQIRLAEPEQAFSAIEGLGIGFDLTLRDLQTQLKNKGHPWERAKAFDGACPVSQFIPCDQFNLLDGVEIEARCNDVVRQQGSTNEMIWRFAELLSYISSWFTLEPGDIVLTGTPQGVFALSPNDKLTVVLDRRFEFSAKVAS